MGHVVHSIASQARKVDALFFILEWVRYGFQKKRIETCCATLVFLHPVGYVGLVVHFCASGAQNIDTLFCMLRWDWYGF
jgi:hypothetical protein